MAPTFASVDWDALLKVVWVSALAGIGACILFAITVYGGSRAGEARANGGNPAAFYAIAVVSFLLFMGAVVFGITVILNK